MNNKEIKITFVLIAAFMLLGIIGFTIAYFTSSVDFENEFTTGLYQTEATETFTSPDNWMPGDTTPKTLTITNTGNVDVKARVCISEEWESDNGDTLPNKVNGERVAILNLANTSDWTKKSNCYEYNDVLEPNDTTSTFINSVTFNPNIEADIECTTSGNTKTCNSSGDGYDNAFYTLTFTVETIQANKANEVWIYRETVYTANMDFEETVIIGSAIPEEIEIYENPNDIILFTHNIFKFYLKHDLVNGIVEKSYVEFVIRNSDGSNYNNGIYTLRGGIDESSLTDKPIFLSNKSQLQAAYNSSNCREEGNRYDCQYESDARTLDVGVVSAGFGSCICGVESNGTSLCGCG